MQQFLHSPRQENSTHGGSDSNNSRGLQTICKTGDGLSNRFNTQYHYFTCLNHLIEFFFLSAANARHEAELRLLASFTPSALASPCVWHPLYCASNSAIVLGGRKNSLQINEQPYRSHCVSGKFRVSADPVALFLRG